jgi:hypothetical protein
MTLGPAAKSRQPSFMIRAKVNDPTFYSFFEKLWKQLCCAIPKEPGILQSKTICVTR